MVIFCVCSFCLFIGHLSAVSYDNSLIFTNPPGTKFTPEDDLIAHVLSLWADDDDDAIKFLFPFLVEYNETFKPSISDPTERCDALKAAARKGNLYARILYAGCFNGGFGRPKNIEKKFKHFQLAADRGSPEAQVLTFLSWSTSKTGESDDKVMLHYLDLAVKQGDGFAQWLRGIFHFGQHEPQAAVRLFKKSAEQGQILGELSYGICLLVGFGTARNERKGVEYLARVKKQGWTIAVFVGGLALRSAGVHSKTATRYFRFAAKHNMPVAQAYYAWALENGFGVKKSTKQAARFYKKAVNGGYGPARVGLRRCRQSRRF